jgi:hypothetical protein
VTSKGGCIFLKERGISRPHAKVKMVVLTNSEGGDKYNLQCFQALKQATTLTPQTLAKFAQLTIPSSSKPSSSKFEKKK